MISSVKLGDAATFVNGYAFKPTDWNGSGLPIIRIQDLTGNAYETNFFGGRLPEKYLVEDGDLLISWSASLGIFEWQQGNAWLNQHIFKVVFDKLEWDKKFFKYLLSFKLSEMERQVHGATMKHITKGKFDNIPIPHPPISIQQKIASILDKADEIRCKDQQLLTKYDELLQSIFYQMFGDPVKNEKGWESIKLKDACFQITDGTHFSPPPKTSGIPYITAKHLKSDGLDFFSNPTYIGQREHQLIFSRCSPSTGDVLYIKDGATTGLAAINEYEFEFSMLSSLALIKPNHSLLNNYYLVYWLNNPTVKEMYLRKFMAGAAIKRFTLTKINSFDILLPEIKLQEKFGEITRNIFKQKKHLKVQAEKSESLFQSLLQKAFKGELVK